MLRVPRACFPKRLRASQLSFDVLATPSHSPEHRSSSITRSWSRALRGTLRYNIVNKLYKTPIRVSSVRALLPSAYLLEVGLGFIAFSTLSKIAAVGD